jgi:GxxExxY protein
MKGMYGRNWDKRINMKYSEITEKIIGAAFKVNTELGNGFQEVIYQRALEIELRAVGLQFVREYEMPIYYKDEVIGMRRVDFLADGKISIELKALTKLENVHFAQAMNYLEAYNLEVGLLINFGGTKLEYHRLTNKKYNDRILHHPSSSSHQSV